MTALLATRAPVTAEISGSADRFQVRRIYCVGRNYTAHAREMGADEREPPFFFTKFADTLTPSGSVLHYPPETDEFHHEGELVIAIGASAFRISPLEALGVVFGYACGLDMTRRDLQFAARDKGRPWDMGKNFSESAVMGPIHRASDIGHLKEGALFLTVNEAMRQQADLADMIWSCAEVVAHLSRFDRLECGDLIYTGTPAGVGAVAPGDRIALTIANLTPLSVTVA